MVMANITTYEGQITFLKTIEGQVRGVQRMVEEQRYCAYILTQLHSIAGAVLRVKDKIFKRHLESCVMQASKNASNTMRCKEIKEVYSLLDKPRGKVKKYKKKFVNQQKRRQQ